MKGHRNKTTFDKKDWLWNGCESEKLAKCAAAVASHQHCISRQMVQASDSHEWLELASEYADNIEPQEIFYANFNDFTFAPGGMIAIFYEKLDLVTLYREIYGDDEDSGSDEGAKCLETICGMTTANFFRYLNTLPNAYLFAMQDRPMMTASPVGIGLLAELAQYG